MRRVLIAVALASGAFFGVSAAGAGAITPGSHHSVHAGLRLSHLNGMTVGRYVEPNGSIGYAYASSSPATASPNSGMVEVNGKLVQSHGVSVTPQAFGVSGAAAAEANIQSHGICDKTLLLAMGAPPAVADMMSKEAGESCPKVGGSARTARQAYPRVGTIFYNTCDYSTGAYNVWAYGCLNQKIAQIYGTTAYILDQIENTTSNSSCNMTMAESADYYQYSGSSPASTHLIFQWLPDSRIPVGNPRNWSVTLGYGSQSFSTSGTIYPDAIEPFFAWFNSGRLTGFGDEWYGNEGAGYLNTPSLDTEATTSNGSIDAGVWNNWYGDNCS